MEVPRARRLVDEFSIKRNDSSTKLKSCAVLNWSTNTSCTATMLWPRPQDCLEDLMKQSRQLSGYDALSVNNSQSPLLFPPLHAGVEQNLDIVSHLIFLCFADITGENGRLETVVTVDPCVSLFNSCPVHHNWHLTSDVMVILPTSAMLPRWQKRRDQSSAPGTTKRQVVRFWPELEVLRMHRRRSVFAVGDQIIYWRGNKKSKSQWSMRWLGLGIVIGHEGLANVWTSHRNAVVKAAGNHIRLAEAEEQLPWYDLYDSLRDTSEQAYFDLCPSGASRDPRCEGPPISSDVPMTPPPVPGDPVPEITADEPMPDTYPKFQCLILQFMPQRAIHVYVGGPMLWNFLHHRSRHRLSHQKLCLSPHLQRHQRLFHLGLHPCPVP